MPYIATSTEKAEAAYMLSDELIAIELKLERAVTVLQDITDDFFGSCDPKTEGGRLAIIQGHVRYGILANIASDYLFGIRKEMRKLKDFSESGRMFAAGEREEP